jgi:anaerobic magnesium-protoporphyrin IX monomethyl ester cyclase
MRNVLLVEPPSRMQVLQRLKARKARVGVPMPFIYIAPYLRRAGFRVEMIDMRLSSFNDLRRYLSENKPVLAGITVMPGNALPRAIHLTRFIKRVSPETKVVWGGAFASLHYEFCLRIPEVDFIGVGDGEETLAELAEVLSQKDYVGNLSEVKGIAYRKDNYVFVTDPRPPVDLDDNPVGAWDLIDRYSESYLGPRGYLEVNTARGCPFRCSFCYNNLLYRGHKRYRTKSISAVMQEIDYLMERYRIEKFKFQDDEFLGRQRRGMALLEEVRSKYPHLKFHLAARIDRLKKEEIVRQLAEYGCESVFVGAESASPEQLESINKGCSTTDLMEAARLCAKYNITAIYSFTCGYPDETDTDLWATLSMAKVLRRIDPKCECLIEIISPIQGTPLFADLDARGKIPATDVAKWCHLTDWKSTRYKPWITRRAFYEAFQLAFYLAFATAGHTAGLRSVTRLLNEWARYRLRDKLPRRLPEFRMLNAAVKAALWGFGRPAVSDLQLETLVTSRAIPAPLPTESVLEDEVVEA